MKQEAFITQFINKQQLHMLNFVFMYKYTFLTSLFFKQIFIEHLTY